MSRVVRLVPPAPAPDPVMAALERQEALLTQILAALQAKKQWEFHVNKDAFGRPVSIEAKQL
jgi:hypothetical protein